VLVILNRKGLESPLIHMPASLAVPMRVPPLSVRQRDPPREPR
jgi:hypothetical protein